ncbi:M28 family peptidase [Nonlabens ulvanivorans]|uniref:PDZ domain-containing protein n=1 Tax=Nonlabens ulvanivorans TaxID=906888 RepID=A0A084JTP5_NONUL|nr:M28 family peptidase [Nonlabens ulvanivorans]KEZ92329.1 peptidase M28 [Nonlabens ulvanivorans]PRX15162.1 PDZ domain-containing protein [Nonlabens ulvanivorans]
MRIATLFIAICLLVSCKTEVKSLEPVKGNMKADVVYLASDDLQGRETGTSYELQAADYIAKRMKESGLEPKGNEGTYFQTFSFKPSSDPHQEAAFTDEKGDAFLTGTNVLGYIDNGAAQTVVIGAHYDHLGMGGEGSLHREGEAIHNGADDNASGVAVMLDLAYELKTSDKKGNNYLFMAFSGEEMGLLGSNYFTKNSTIALDSITYMINMDMVGRLNEENTLAVYGTGTSPRWNQIINAVNKDFELALSESGVGPSDHTSFYLNDIPVLHFFTGQHEDYHKPGDDAEKLNYDGMQKISDYILRITAEFDNAGKLAFRKTKNESEEVPRFKVGLGVVPDYLFTGKGMRIDGVSEEKPAQKAGLLKGDVVVKLGDSTIVDMMSYMRTLATFDNGDKTMVTVDRDGKMVEKEIEF